MHEAKPHERFSHTTGGGAAMSYMTDIKLTPWADRKGVNIKVVGEDGAVIDDGYIEAKQGVPFEVWYDDLVLVLKGAIAKLPAVEGVR
jgi:F420-dependent methylenetetrahydromethanopterin dehydrogenase